MNKQKLTKLIQLKMTDKLGAKAVETEEMQALTDEIASLFSIQNEAFVDEIKQLKQALLEVSLRLTNSNNYLQHQLDMHTQQLENTGDLLNSVVELVVPEDKEEECDCLQCQLASVGGENAINNVIRMFNNSPLRVVRVK